MASFTLRFDVAAFLAAGVDELRLVPLSASESTPASTKPARYAGIEDGESYTPYQDDGDNAGLYHQQGRYAGVPDEEEKIFDEGFGEDSGGQTVATYPTEEGPSPVTDPAPAWTKWPSKDPEPEPAPKRRGRPRKTAEEIIEHVEERIANAEVAEAQAPAPIPEPVASAPEPIQIDIEEAIAASQEQGEDPFFSSVNRKTLQQLMVKHGSVIGFPKFTAWLQSTPYPKFSEVKDEEISNLARLFYTTYPDAARSM